MNEEIRSTQELIAEAYTAYKEVNEDDDKYWPIIARLQKEGSSCEFEAAQILTKSDDPIKREIGADILGQLGWSKKCFHNESVAILIKLLSDEVDDVIASAAFSLGHRDDPCCIPYLIQLIEHKNPWVRNGVTFGLCGLNDEQAVNGLIKLSTDVDYDVRNWATFGLGSMCDIDTEELRKALFERLSEDDHEIRGEALVGLAKRKDENIKDALKKELSYPFNGSWVLEAAELMPDPEYCPLLQKLRKQIIEDYEPGRFVKDADKAIEACCKNTDIE